MVVAVTIRKLEPWEVALHRDIRLRALRDAPDAFGETAAEAEVRPQSYWEDLTQSVTGPGRHVMFLACEGSAIYGSTYGLRDRESLGAGRVGGTWVEPAYRRRGIGTALLQAVISWARAERFSHMRLWAPAASIGALALYRQAGFNATGNSRPLPTNVAQQILELERKLPAQ
jgi:GNAT superfamily N-acetyltransferase